MHEYKRLTREETRQYTELSEQGNRKRLEQSSKFDQERQNLDKAYDNDLNETLKEQKKRLEELEREQQDELKITEKRLRVQQEKVCYFLSNIIATYRAGVARLPRRAEVADEAGQERVRNDDTEGGAIRRLEDTTRAARSATDGRGTCLPQSRLRHCIQFTGEGVRRRAYAPARRCRPSSPTDASGAARTKGAATHSQQASVA